MAEDEGKMERKRTLEAGQLRPCGAALPGEPCTRLPRRNDRIEDEEIGIIYVFIHIIETDTAELPLCLTKNIDRTIIGE